MPPKKAAQPQPGAKQQQPQKQQSGAKPSQPAATPRGPTLPPPSRFPPLGYAVRGKDGSRLYSMQHSGEVAETQFVAGPNHGSLTYSKDGSLCAVADSSNVGGFVQVIHVASGRVISKIPEAGVKLLYFSPLNTFLLTWRAFSSSDELGNLGVWRIPRSAAASASSSAAAEQQDAPSSSDASVPPAPLLETRLRQKEVSWPSIQWNHDETIAARLSEFNIELYEGRNIKELKSSTRIEGVRVLSVSSSNFIGVFVPEIKGAHGWLQVFRFPDLSRPIIRKVIMRGDSAEFKWNARGNMALVTTSSEVSASNYYGESLLHFINCINEASPNVRLDKEGPVHDFEWSPVDNEFVVVYGYMPARAVLFDFRLATVHNFGEMYRNTIRWSPSGRYLVLGGFSNLTGEMDFFDRNNKTTKVITHIGRSEAHSAACFEWSPDNRFFLTATLSPKLRISNGVKIFKYNGQLVHVKEYPEIYQATWKSALPSVYPQRDPTPPPAGASSPPAASAQLQTPRGGNGKQPAAAGPSSSPSAPITAAAPGVIAAPAPAATKYIPPALRAKMAAASGASASNSNAGMIEKVKDKATLEAEAAAAKAKAEEDAAAAKARAAEQAEQDSKLSAKAEITTLRKRGATIRKWQRDVQASKARPVAELQPFEVERLTKEAAFAQELEQIYSKLRALGQTVDVDGKQ